MRKQINVGVSEEQHAAVLKLAQSRNMTIREYVLAALFSTVPDSSLEKRVLDLEAKFVLLDARVDHLLDR